MYLLYINIFICASQYCQNLIKKKCRCWCSIVLSTFQSIWKCSKVTDFLLVTFHLVDKYGSELFLLAVSLTFEVTTYA